MKTTGLFPKVHIDTAKVAAVGQVGGVLLTETIRAAGLDRALAQTLGRWRQPLARHDPGKIILDLAISLVLGGEALSDIAALRAEPGIYGPVASDPTVSRLITVLSEDADEAVAAISTARQQARARVWHLAGDHAPDHGRSVADPLIIDATLITSHSEKQHAAPTFKRGFGFHPLMAFADHGPDGTGEGLVAHLRPGNAGSNTATDHITVTRAALQQLPGKNPMSDLHDHCELARSRGSCQPTELRGEASIMRGLGEWSCTSPSQLPPALSGEPSPHACARCGRRNPRWGRGPGTNPSRAHHTPSADDIPAVVVPRTLGAFRPPHMLDQKLLS